MAIFGGSFDPPHIGHLAIVKKALKKLDIDKLVVVPAYLNPLKTHSFLDAPTRSLLLKKLFKKKSIVEVCDYEINQGRPVYSIETIEYLKGHYNPDKIYLIVGADNYHNFHLWNDHEKIKEMVELVVVTREGFKAKKSEKIKKLKVDIKISSTQLRHTLNINYIPKKIRDDVKMIWQSEGQNI